VIILFSQKQEITQGASVYIEDFIITTFCLIDDELQHATNGETLRCGGFDPQLIDSEMITMEIIAEFLGIDTDKGTWEYFRDHWLDLFPNIGSRANFAKHAANLWCIKQMIQKNLATRMGAFCDTIHLADGLPIPVCKFARANFSRIFDGDASYGYCASKKETYYGFKGNVSISSEGIITGITVTAANIDERESLWEVVDGIQGLLIADKGLIGANFQQEFNQTMGIQLQTAVRSNMQETRSDDILKWLVSTRRLVETVIGQLTDRFNIEKVRARKLWTFTNRVARKVLAHTVCIFINKQLGNAPLQFELLRA
jgi:hypothetical protein